MCESHQRCVHRSPLAPVPQYLTDPKSPAKSLGSKLTGMSIAAAFIHRTLSGLLNEPGKPRLTWYGGDYERIELSGAVLGNWVNKTTNLLVEEFDAEPTSTIELDLPPHWRFITWALATLRTGATLSLQHGSSADLVVTATPETHVGANELVVVTLGALARKYPGTLPPGAIDAASAVMTYSDGLGYVSPTDTSSPAVTADALSLTYGELPAWAAAHTTTQGERTLLRCHSDSPEVQTALLRNALGIWSTGGSVVIFGSAMSAELADDAARLQRILDSENITSVLELN